MANITKEFLQEALGEEIDTFQVLPASFGDSFNQFYAINLNLAPPKSILITNGGNRNHQLPDIRSETTDEVQKENVDLDAERPVFYLSNPSTKSKSNTNYKFNHQSIQSKDKNNSKELSLLLKCYPAVNRASQEFITSMERNVFRKELLVYSVFIPELIRFQRRNSNSVSFDTPMDHKKNHTFYKPPFPEFFYGRAVDDDGMGEEGSKTCNDPLENCILMTDLAKSGGFKRAIRPFDLDLAHARIIITAQAKLHALSWAYKLITNNPTLTSRFDFFATTGACDGVAEKTRETKNFELFRRVVKNAEGIQREKKEDYLSSLDRSEQINSEVSSIYSYEVPPKESRFNKDNLLRLSVPHNEDEEPWLVLIHGDASLNNMLFQYDETTGEPLQVLFVDLQMTREGDPFTDLAYTLYTSTTRRFRQQYLNDLLRLYVVTFIQVCEHFRVTPLHGFQLSEVQRRFHRAKAYGFTMAVMELPDFLNQPTKFGSHFEEVDNYKKHSDSEKSKSSKNNSTFADRVLELVAELHAEGVI